MIRTIVTLCLLPAIPCCPQEKWKLLWSDEFNAPAGTPPDASKWTYDLGGGGWGNRELEVYTNQPENVAHDGRGNLVIHALKTAAGGYTSARIKTLGKFDIKYGRIAARMKIPFGQGIWPAFWMLGNDIGTAGWPVCGEIDIMENIGKEPSTVHATVHGPGYSGGAGIGSKIDVPKGRVADEFHTFEVRWAPERLTFFMDGKQYHEVTPNNRLEGKRWVFDHPFFMLLNLAVGGGWPGNPDGTTTFPQHLTIDWVRVWEPAGPPND